MSDAALLPEALSATLLQWHRGSRDWPAASFQQRACELLETVLPFDACAWGSVPAGSAAGAPLALRGLHAQGLAFEALSRWLDGGAQPDPEYGAALSASRVEPMAARRIELWLWRRHSAPPFNEADALTLQFAMPHLVEAQRENHLSRAHEGWAPPRRSHALCHEDGELRQIDEQGLVLLRAEWPRWRPPQLPPPLCAALAALPATTPQAVVWCGQRASVLMSRCGQGVLLELRRCAAVDRLSERQREIAMLYAEGRSGPQIAAELLLSPSTVNNHLGTIFRKLGVSNKVGLLDAVRPGLVSPAALQ